MLISNNPQHSDVSKLPTNLRVSSFPQKAHFTKCNYSEVQPKATIDNKRDNYETVLPGHFTNHKCIY